MKSAEAICMDPQNEQKGHFVWGVEQAIKTKSTNAEDGPARHLKLRFLKALVQDFKLCLLLEVAAADTAVISHCDPGQGSATEKEVNIALLWAD